MPYKADRASLLKVDYIFTSFGIIKPNPVCGGGGGGWRGICSLANYNAAYEKT